jgi:hypothetical protein
MGVGIQIFHESAVFVRLDENSGNDGLYTVGESDEYRVRYLEIFGPSLAVLSKH